MAEVIELPDRERVEREASEWIARLQSESVSSADRAAFEAWREASPRNQRAYEELSVTWQRFTGAGRLVRAVSLGNALGAVGAARRPARRWPYAAAAALAIIAISAAWWTKSLSTSTVFQTAVGEHASVRLPDGSSLELNSDSRARVKYGTVSRVVTLERGEAYFKVAHEASRPFWVVAPNSWVRAVGTEFNVYLREGGVRVTVREGIVKVASASDRGRPSDEALAHAASSLVHAGQQVDLEGATTQIRALAPASLARSTSWRQGTVFFANEPLGQVIAELSRYTTLDIELEDAALRTLPVGGTFEASPAGAEALLTMLRDGFGLEMRREGDARVVIVDRP